MQFLGSSCLFRVCKLAGQPGMVPLTPLVLPGENPTSQKEMLLWGCSHGHSCAGVLPQGACGCTSHHQWSFSLQGFSQVLVPMHIPGNRVLLSLQVCLVGFAVGKQIISGGGQNQGGMRGKCLVGVVQQPRWSCGCCLNSDEMWQQQSAGEIPKSHGKRAQMNQHWQSCWDCGITFHPLFV